MSEFDARAAEWDSNPMHLDRSAAIVEEIKKRLHLNRDMTALEYGAGTGIASFLLRDDLKTITLMDNSAEMVRITQEKIEATKAENLSVLNFDLEHDDFKTGRFDLIFTQMVLHHVADTDTILKRFGEILNKGGYLAIADLYEEDGSFHGEGFTGHNGFDPARLASSLRKYNFMDISFKSCYMLSRTISDTETRNFDIFLLTARLK
jgi:tRNA (cmo5U34)-methyltransferase